MGGGNETQHLQLVGWVEVTKPNILGVISNCKKMLGYHPTYALTYVGLSPNLHQWKVIAVNTPSHYILNLVLLGSSIAPKQTLAITIGAILPDVPIFIFYGVSKLIYKLPESEIWGKAYYEPFWQNLVALFHSFPIAIVGLILCFYWKWQTGLVLFLSIIFHSLLDIPVHNDDAHRHFFPLSNYRFISPISYWDPAHYGRIVALIEVLLVVAVTPLAFGLVKSGISKGVIVAIDALYIVGYVRLYLNI